MTNQIPFERVYFTYKRFGGGATMGCYQPLIACQRLGIPATAINFKHIENDSSKIKNSAIFLMKVLPSQRTIDRLKNNANILVAYPGDGAQRGLINYFRSVSSLDGVIVGSTVFESILDSKRKEKSTFLTRVIPANHDYFLDSSKFKEQREASFKLYFGGSRNPSGPTQGDLGLSKDFDYAEGYFHSLKHMFNNMKYASSEELEKYALEVAAAGKCETLEGLIASEENPSKYSCHYAVRAPWVSNYHTQWNTKTGGKVSTAAASGANIITSLDPCVRELIDESYPYSIDTETEDFKNNYKLICSDMVEYARKTFNTKVWWDGLRMLEKVKERTTTERITLDYIDFMKDIWETNKGEV